MTSQQASHAATPTMDQKLFAKLMATYLNDNPRMKHLAKEVEDGQTQTPADVKVLSQEAGQNLGEIE